MAVAMPQSHVTVIPVTGMDIYLSFRCQFIDTPGILEPSYKLQQRMMQNALRSASESDLLLLMADSYAPPSKLEQDIFRKITEES